MPKLIFVNLPVSDLPKSIAFYEALGAVKNEQFTDHTAACMVFSETIHVMLLTHDKFSQFTPKKIANARETTEAAGGAVDIGPKQDYGFMYGRSFEDLDGHIWEVMWMDIEAAKETMGEMASA